MKDDEESEQENPRQVARRARTEAGDHSARVAHAILQLPESAFKRLKVDSDLLADMVRARSVSAHGARRREERFLSGILRKIDLSDLEAQLVACEATDSPSTRLFHAAEAWRTRLMDGGEPALEKFLAECGDLDRGRWIPLVDNARMERSRGRPKGSARALFREIMAVLTRKFT